MRKTKKFWYVTEYGVKEVEGQECRQPERWWCPAVGYTLVEGQHLFDTEFLALRHAIAESSYKIARETERKRALENRMFELR